MNQPIYEVVVGNVGTVYDGPDGGTAGEEYRAYVAISKSGLGRAGGEVVTLFKDGEIQEEYDPEQE